MFTADETDRQDLVDNLCYTLVCDLADNHNLEWDIEWIAEVRECVQEIICDKLHLMTEQQFYPYREV